uniref:Uncharacterized protein n=1 Tax=Pararge aegeria TaxID=116150 RepID=S4P0Y1_9NEOP
MLLDHKYCVVISPVRIACKSIIKWMPSSEQKRALAVRLITRLHIDWSNRDHWKLSSYYDRYKPRPTY